MARVSWGKVYKGDDFAGILREEPGSRYVFTYDENYMNAGGTPIAHTLPLQNEPHISHHEIHPFFDNLVAEGWMEQAQTRLLGKRYVSRFELLLTFGRDCAGAVHIEDPEPNDLSHVILEADETIEKAMLVGRASLSGVQPKLGVVLRGNRFRPAKVNELSTHIAKFPSQHHANLVLNEYLTTEAFKCLVPQDEVVEMKMEKLEGFDQDVLLIKRFDRDGQKRIHFEEMNALLGYFSHQKYEGAYQDMANFIYETPDCLPAENYRLFVRILAGILLGNTDMHLKNFACFHTENGLRLTPTYDQVAAFIYRYKDMALAIGGAKNLKLGELKPKNILTLAKDFRLSDDALMMAVKQLEKNKEAAMQAIQDASIPASPLKTRLTQDLEKRWKGTFALIGKTLSKKR